MTALSITRIARAQPKARPLSPSELQELLVPCLGWCPDHPELRLAAPGVGDIYRSKELELAARNVFPESCHTPFDQALADRFEVFEKVRVALGLPMTGAAERAKRELTRPMALLVTDWSASLFDGAMSPDTAGFINDDGMPPWNTWITLLHVSGSHGQACLLSWVPQWLSADVNRAIEIDAAQSLSWLIVTPKDGLTLHGWGRAW